MDGSLPRPPSGPPGPGTRLGLGVQLPAQLRLVDATDNCCGLGEERSAF